MNLLARGGNGRADGRGDVRSCSAGRRAGSRDDGRPRRDGRLPGHRYLDGLKTQLGITANQERAWKEYADAVSGISEQMQALRQTRFNSMGAASWEERCNLMNQMFQARQQAFDTVHHAALALLAALTLATRRRRWRSSPASRTGEA